MLTYPICITKNKAGVLSVKFPDFPGCSVPCPQPNNTGDNEHDAIIALFERASKLAAWYLVGTPAKPGWIIKRLKDGYAIPTPDSYPQDPFALHVLETTISLPEDIGIALRFHWLPYSLQRNRERTAAVLGMSIERLWEIEHAQAKPNHREMARLRFLEKNSHVRLIEESEKSPQQAAS